METKIQWTVFGYEGNWCCQCLVAKTKRSKPFCVHLDKLKPHTGDSVPVSWLGDATQNRLSGDAADGSAPVATAPVSETPLIDFDDSITFNVPEMLDQSFAADAIDLPHDTVHNTVWMRPKSSSCCNAITIM